MFDLNTLPGNGWNASRLERFRQIGQEFLDVRQLLTDLPADDPDKTTDPNKPSLFWGDADGNPDPAGTHLIGRSAVLEVWTENGRPFGRVRRP